MKSTLRCCISCILPCGALDVIRIVHSNGRVEELTGSVKASDIMKAHPKHVLKKPSSSSTSAAASASSDGVVPRIVIVPPDADLQRGKIYFLMPLPSSSAPPIPENNRPRSSSSSSSSATARSKKRKEHRQKTICNSRTGNLLASSDRYLNDILSEKLSTQRDRRRGRVAVWRPHLESISESNTD
ncbi:uncharacterized protein LOC114758926 [Neltuma alba]|uniref:uncharacterized protein LOC114747444 n=1 Tax=Neltuma alba TaxID=207710 RepID=UPI0010A44AE0|nr:uncharacterized protein LOC114747444 [Prosopis alba]XP_028803863.1 uncharacterized protein LOC114758926 [Prosopis alba]